MDRGGETETESPSLSRHSAAATPRPAAAAPAATGNQSVPVSAGGETVDMSISMLGCY